MDDRKQMEETNSIHTCSIQLALKLIPSSKLLGALIHSTPQRSQDPRLNHSFSPHIAPNTQIQSLPPITAVPQNYQEPTTDWDSRDAG